MASTSDVPVAFLHKNPIFSGLSDVYNAFQERRAKLGLSNPGLVENIAKGTSQTDTAFFSVPERKWVVTAGRESIGSLERC